jgi:alpha-tubulin suppressor-like RCC1 family protein
MRLLTEHPIPARTVSVALLAALIACGSGDAGGPLPAVTAVRIDDPGRPIEEGETLSLTVTLTSYEGDTITGRTVRWTSSDTLVASINANGVLTGRSQGTSTIRAAVEGRRDAVVVAVVPAAVVSVDVIPAYDTLPLGGTQQLGVVVRDARGGVLTGRPITWRALTPSVAVVDDTGLVRSLLRGDASVTATSEGVVGTGLVSVLEAFASLAPSRGGHACGLAMDGAAWCWGTSYYGALGRSDVFESTVPVPVEGGLTFTSLAVGSGHTCGLTATGQAYCWGSNYGAELGDGTRNDRYVPGPVGGGLSFTVLATPSYAWGTCGLTALGETFCWGGRWWITDSVVSDTLPRSLGPGVPAFAQLELGSQFGCGRSLAGEAYCWGGNSWGQLGVGDTLPRSAPTPVSGGRSYTEIVVGWSHACGLAAAGEVFCWGYTIGPSGVASRVTVPTTVTGAPPFRHLAAGGGSHTCALTEDGEAYCWGSNYSGEVGQSSSATYPDPIAVRGGKRFTALWAGTASSCGAGVDGFSYCWGSNELGSLGIGVAVEHDRRYQPARVVFK